MKQDVRECGIYKSLPTRFYHSPPKNSVVQVQPTKKGLIYFLCVFPNSSTVVYAIRYQNSMQSSRNSTTGSFAVVPKKNRICRMFNQRELHRGLMNCQFSSLTMSPFISNSSISCHHISSSKPRTRSILQCQVTWIKATHVQLFFALRQPHIGYVFVLRHLLTQNWKGTLFHHRSHIHAHRHPKVHV